MAVSGTIKDSDGNTWTWVNQGSNYALVMINSVADKSVAGPVPTVNWRGDRWYPSSLQVKENGDIISGNAPGSDWGV